jgi:hypothetical protein
MYRQKLIIAIVHKYIKEILQEKRLCPRIGIKEGSQAGAEASSERGEDCCNC